MIGWIVVIICIVALAEIIIVLSTTKNRMDKILKALLAIILAVMFFLVIMGFGEFVFKGRPIKTLPKKTGIYRLTPLGGSNYFIFMPSGKKLWYDLSDSKYEREDVAINDKRANTLSVEFDSYTALIKHYKIYRTESK